MDDPLHPSDELTDDELDTVLAAYDAALSNWVHAHVNPAPCWLCQRLTPDDEPSDETAAATKCIAPGEFPTCTSRA